MQGDAPFEVALAARLAIMKPTKSQIAHCQSQSPKLSDGIEALVALLQGRDVSIYLISGGFDVLIEPVADLLRIPRDHIFANSIFFDSDGNYGGFDTTRPTSRTGRFGDAFTHDALHSRRQGGGCSANPARARI